MQLGEWLESVFPFIAAGKYRRQAKACYEKGDFDGALLALNQYIQVRPLDAVSYLLRGDLLARRGDLEGAIKDFSQSLTLGPTYRDVACIKRGSARSKIDDLDGAIADYDMALRLNTRHASIVYARRGYAHREREISEEQSRITTK